MDIFRLKSEDDVLLFCVRTKARTLADIGQKCRTSKQYVWQYFINQGIDFKVIKQHLKKIDFVDSHPWWNNQYKFEEGEEARPYTDQYWVTNYGTVLTKRYKKWAGHTYEKFVALKPFINEGFYQLILAYQKPKRNVFVHRMVGEVWCERPPNTKAVKHKNDNTLDNHYWNLCWI